MENRKLERNTATNWVSTSSEICEMVYNLKKKSLNKLKSRMKRVYDGSWIL